jgi:hypothetical protein
MTEKTSRILIEVCVDSVDSAFALVSAATSSSVLQSLTHIEALFAEVQIGSSCAETWALEVDSKSVVSFPDHKGLFAGGTTPSVGLLKAVQKAVPNTPIMVCDCSHVNRSQSPKVNLV